MTKDARYQKFRDDMVIAGRDVREYEGRFFYKGPAVACETSELQDVIRETDVAIQWDQLGLGLIVYPR